MSTKNKIKDYVEDVLRTNNLAVLATEGDGQPHASLIAITPMGDLLHLIFATYRNTRKYHNLINNGKIAILFENRSTKSIIQKEITVLTAYGNAIELDISISDAARKEHLSRHPELESFILSDDCAIFSLKVNAYQVIRGIEDISWWNIQD